MPKRTLPAVALAGLLALTFGCNKPVASDEPTPVRVVFDVRDYGATGIKEELA